MKFILVKHSLPEIIPSIPGNEWRLSAEGRQRCLPLAAKLAPYQPDVIVSSQETKAWQTGQIIADTLVLPLETVDGLHEHERRTEPFGDQAQFEASIAALFERPNELVYGEETAAQALDRFSRAVTALVERHDNRNLVVVAHGTVITLLVAQNNPIAPFPFWKRLRLPSFVVLSLPELALLSVVEEPYSP